ncbi:MAG: DUF4232 domain-containing protein [Chloroflexota bacterium]
MFAASFVGPPPAARRSLVAVLAVAALAGACGGESATVGTQETTPPPSAGQSASPAATVDRTVAPTASPGLGPCDSGALMSRVTRWDGAAGSRIGTVELVNIGTSTCVVFVLARPQLVDGTGSILIDGSQPAALKTVEIIPGGIVTAAVQVSNYCGPGPVPPVTVAFVLPDGLGRVVAAPLSTTDTGGLPPCNGPAGSPGTIGMQPWAP